MPHAERDRLDSWLLSIAGVAPDEAQGMLRARWRTQSDGHLGALVRWFLEYRSVSIVVHGDHAWLMCVRPETESHSETLFLIPEPTPEQHVAKRLCERGFDDPLLTRFIATLAGMRESLPPDGGVFAGWQDDWRLLNEDWMAEQLGGYPEWEGSLLLFTARNSDTLLVHPTGKVGWWIGEMRTIELFASSVDEFCQRYTDYKRTAWRKVAWADRLIAWPFDSFGPTG
jgi:hypothetical protein